MDWSQCTGYILTHAHSEIFPNTKPGVICPQAPLNVAHSSHFPLKRKPKRMNQKYPSVMFGAYLCPHLAKLTIMVNFRAM